MRLARPMLCLSQVQTLSLSLSKPLKTWNWTKWRAESSRRLLPLLRPQCELLSFLFNYQKMTVHCQLPSYVVSYLLNSVVCKWHVVMANIYYSYPQMQWLFDVKICIVEIHTSVIILWFFYLYFMKGTKLHWNICCYKRENVDVIWIRLDTTMQCRGINRKDCSQVTDFGNFGFQSLLRRLGVLEKKIESRLGCASSTFNFFLQNPQPPEQALRPKFPKSVTCEQSLH